ncbi:MAG: hypothetical protein MJE68_32945 [Proteobacteria bacterium]|nr:hypothetical protein [Pseudomonadota bacterium]
MHKFFFFHQYLLVKLLKSSILRPPQPRPPSSHRHRHCRILTPPTAQQQPYKSCSTKHSQRHSLREEGAEQQGRGNRGRLAPPTRTRWTPAVTC